MVSHGVEIKIAKCKNVTHSQYCAYSTFVCSIFSVINGFVVIAICSLAL